MDRRRDEPHRREVTAMETTTGSAQDRLFITSILLCFLFWDVVYVTRYDDTNTKARSEATSLLKSEDASSDSPTTLDMPLPKILTDDTRHIIHRSRVRLPLRGGENNLKLEVETSRPEFSSSQNATRRRRRHSTDD
jgi:hypothetical protein